MLRSEWGEQWHPGARHVLGEALPALAAHMLAHWSPAATTSGPQRSSGAWSQMDAGPLDRPAAAQGADGPQLSGPTAHWGPLYAACLVRVEGMPQVAGQHSGDPYLACSSLLASTPAGVTLLHLEDCGPFS
jgi:hypothetical protein